MFDGPFRGSESIAAGLLTRNQLRGPGFHRLFHDVYVPAALPLDLATRSRAAYLLVRDQGGALGGYSAAVLLGADCAPVRAPVEVLAKAFLRPRAGVRISYASLPTADVAVVAGCRVTAPVRTAWDLARRLLLVEAVIAVDTLAHTGPFDPAELLARRDKQPGARGVRRLDRVVELADPRAESPRESRLRVGLVLAGLPVPEVQYEVCDEFGHVLARVDLAYPAAKVVVEYDGRAAFRPASPGTRPAPGRRARRARLADPTAGPRRSPVPSPGGPESRRGPRAPCSEHGQPIATVVNSVI